MASYQSILKLINEFKPENATITNKTYATKIRTVLKSGKNIENYDEITSYLITKYKQKTYKSFVTSIVVYLKAQGKNDIAKKFSSELTRVNEVIQESYKSNVKTDGEELAWVTKTEIEAILVNLKKLTSVKVVEGDMTMFTNYQKYLVLNLYHLIPPVRNDFVGCEVWECDVDKMDTTKNYILLNSKKLVLNRYKTSKIYGSGNEIDLPEELCKIVKRWIDIRRIILPELDCVKELLLTKNLQPFGQVNLTQFLNRIFQRNVSSTMLRKSYLSWKYPVTVSVIEMEKDAQRMQHSVSVQQTVYRKKSN